MTFCRNLWRADAVVLSGGTHFHDLFGLRSFRILAVMLVSFWIASVSGARLIYAGVGVGPVRTQIGRFLVGRLLRLSAFTVVRDRESRRVVESLAPGTAVMEACDLVLAGSLAQTGDEEAKSVDIGISLVPMFELYRGDPALDDRVVELLADALMNEAVAGSLPSVRLHVLFEGRGVNDVSILSKLAERLEGVAVTMSHEREFHTGVRHVREDRILIASRYHSAVLGYVAGVPMAIIAYEPKCAAFARQIKLPERAIIQPDDLLLPGTIGCLVRDMNNDPGAFMPLMPVEELRNSAKAAIEECVRYISGETAGMNSHV